MIRLTRYHLVYCSDRENRALEKAWSKLVHNFNSMCWNLERVLNGDAENSEQKTWDKIEKKTSILISKDLDLI